MKEEKNNIHVTNLFQTIARIDTVNNKKCTHEDIENKWKNNIIILTKK